MRDGPSQMMRWATGSARGENKLDLRSRDVAGGYLRLHRKREPRSGGPGQEVASVTRFAFPLSTETMMQFCQRWKIRELALFGSVLRTDFRPDSDVDVLVTFTDEADWGLLADDANSECR